MSELNLNLEAVKTQSARVVVPTGNYPVEIKTVEVKESNNKGNYYIKAGMYIQDGEYKGTNVDALFNIVNKNADAQRIGLSQLKTVLTVAGYHNPNFLKDSSELVGLRFNAYIEEEDHTFKNDAGETIETTQNRVKSFYEYSENTGTAAAKVDAKKATTGTTAPAPAPATKNETVAAPTPAQGDGQQKFPWMS